MTSALLLLATISTNARAVRRCNGKILSMPPANLAGCGSQQPNGVLSKSSAFHNFQPIFNNWQKSKSKCRPNTSLKLHMLISGQAFEMQQNQMVPTLRIYRLERQNLREQSKIPRDFREA
jgi:hypothetical protein